MKDLDPARWRAASQRLDAALELPEDERTQWLAALREEDPVLAEDVRVLLEEYEVVREARFLEEDDRSYAIDQDDRDAGEVGGQFAGRTFGAYRLVSAIGHGGMGVVWLAERCDGQFEGRAAVKLLQIHFGASEPRFRREATILGRLTHPNIAHLVDAGVADGQPYLVLELVEGQPIDRYCDDRTLDVPSRLELFLNVLGAVSHAHTQRIVHRDIKPSNVLVRHDGHVKLLDFGIAKLLERDGHADPVTTLTREHGAPLTPAYAAPEQVGGGTVTIATDVYALGVLLYVLLTGRHPYGDISSPVEVLKAVADLDPPAPSAVVATGRMPKDDLAALAASRATNPQGLQRLLKGDLDTIVAKALKKDPKERYGSVDELADDIRRYLASEPIRASRDSLVHRTVKFARRRAALTVAGIITILAAGSVAGFVAIRALRERDPVAVPESQIPVPVTTEPGDEKWPSLSPDGTRIAFSWVPPNASNNQIALKTIGSDAVVRLTDTEADDVTPVWSPDGQLIAFTRSSRGHPRQICLVPLTGGPPRVLHTDAGGPTGLAWWKGSNALMFSRRTTATGPFRIASLNLATLDMRFLTDPPAARDMGTHGDLLPALAPDERTLAFVREAQEGRDVFLLDLVTNVERRLTRDHQRISGLTWSSDGQAVIMSSVRSGVEALYRVALTDGAIARVPSTSDGATSPMAGPGGLVFSQVHDDSNIYRVDLRDGRTLGPARPLIASSRSDTAMDISADGRSIAFLSTRSGGSDIWVASADGTSPRRLTSLSVTSGPRWSPDGRSIAFGALPAGHSRPDIWLVDANGGTPKRLDDHPSYDTVLAWAADGTSVYFRSDRSGVWQVWKVPTQGGAATQVTYNLGLNAQESRDGSFLFYSNDVPEVWRRSLQGSSAEQLMIRLPPGTHWGGNWTVGARGLYYVTSELPGAEGIDFLPFEPAGGRPIRIVSLAAPVAPAVSVLAVAPDDSWLLWTQADYRNSDIMMIAPRQ